MEHLNLDIEKIAEAPLAPKGGPYPAPMVDIAKYWVALANGKAPRWSEFRMTALANAMPHMTILHKLEDGRFAFEFCGSAVSALFGQDLTGETVTAFDGTRAEIDWAERVRPVLADGACHVQSGVAEPPYTSPIDFLALDMPLRNADNEEIGYIVGCTVPRMH
jgi:hypothetical protein